MAEISKEQVKKAVLEGLEKVYECTRIQGRLSDKQKELVEAIIEVLFTTKEERNLKEMKSQVKEAQKYSTEEGLTCPKCEKKCSTSSGLTLHMKRHAAV